MCGRAVLGCVAVGGGAGVRVSPAGNGCQAGLTRVAALVARPSDSQTPLLSGSRGLPGKTCVNVAKVNTDLEEPVSVSAADHPLLVVIVGSSDGNSGPRAPRGSPCFGSEYLDPDCLGRRSDNLKVQAFVRSEDGSDGHDWGGRS